MGHILRSDNTQEAVLFHSVHSEEFTPDLRLDGKYLYPLSQLCMFSVLHVDPTGSLAKLGVRMFKTD